MGIFLNCFDPGLESETYFFTNGMGSSSWGGEYESRIADCFSVSLTEKYLMNLRSNVTLVKRRKSLNSRIASRLKDF